ncbi:hypothetical protein D3C85_1389980 [compost metagenome]
MREDPLIGGMTLAHGFQKGRCRIRQPKAGGVRLAHPTEFRKAWRPLQIGVSASIHADSDLFGRQGAKSFGPCVQRLITVLADPLVTEDLGHADP